METEVPKPSWTPVSVEPASDVESRACEYTNKQRAFAVYTSGTIVFSDSVQARPDDDYHSTLEAAVMQSPDFKVMPMEDGNYLVRFSGPVTGVVLSGFFKANRESIQAALIDGGLLPGEEIVAPVDVPEEHYWVGLFARAKLYADARSLQIASRFTP